MLDDFDGLRDGAHRHWGWMTFKRPFQFPEQCHAMPRPMPSLVCEQSPRGTLARGMLFGDLSDNTPIATKIVLITCSGDRSVARGYVTATREDASGKSYVTIDWIKQADPEVTLPIGEYELVTEEMLNDDETGRDYRGKVYLPKVMT